MNPIKILLSVLKGIGKTAFTAALAKALKRTSPARWADLETAFATCRVACHEKDADALAEELTEVLFGIKP